MYYIQIQTHLTNVLFCIIVPERLSHVFNILGFFVLKAMRNQYFWSTKTEGILNHAALLSIVLNDAISITSQIILGNLYCHLLSFRYIHWWLNIFSCVFIIHWNRRVDVPIITFYDIEAVNIYRSHVSYTSSRFK